METLTFINAKGDSISFDGVSFSLVSVNGLGDVEADNQTQKSPFQDGSTLIQTLLNERFVDLEFIVRGVDYQQVSERRREFSKVTNPKLGKGTLRYDNGFLVREIDAVAESVPVFPDGENRGNRHQRGMLTFLCPSPYWKSTSITEEPTFESLFQFPFEGTFEMGIQRDQRTIINDGDAPAPIYVEFYGAATNPVITNLTTGEFIKVNQTLNEGEFMRVDTTDGRKTVEFVSSDGTVTNVFNWIDLDSTFFKLAIGENIIEYSADSDIQGAIVNIRYSKLYNAV